MVKIYRENVVDVLQRRNVLEYPVYTNLLIRTRLRYGRSAINPGGNATVNDLLMKMREENTDINWVKLGTNNYAYWLPDEQMVKISQKPRRFVIGWE